MAFPTTSVLDDFNRADGSIEVGANWNLLGVMSGNNPSGLTVISNQMGKGSGGWHNASWNATFGPDSEVFTTVATLPSGNGETIAFLLARVINTGNPATCAGYGLHIGNNTGGNETWDFYHFTGVSQVNIGSATATAVAAGDSVGFAIVGDQLQAWHKPAAGSWTNIGNLTDTTFTGQSGVIGIEIQNAVSRFDDFGGGTVNVGTPTDTTRDARVTGQLGSDTTRDVRVTGAAGSDTTRDVRVTSTDANSDNREVRATGSRFPKTPRIDDFNGRGSLGSKYGRFVSGEPDFGVVSDEAVNTADAWSGNIYNTQYPADQEVWCQITGKGADDTFRIFSLYCRVQNPNTATPDGYGVIIEPKAAGDTFRLVRLDNNTTFDLKTAVHNFEDGDWIGLRAVDNVIQAFHSSNGVTWKVVATGFDATYDLPGYVGFESNNNQFTFDNLGAGEVDTDFTERDVRVFGDIGNFDTRDVRVTGRADSSTTRDVRVTGVSLAPRRARVTWAEIEVPSPAPTSSTTRDVRVTGQILSTDTRDVRVTGAVGAPVHTVDVRVTGVAPAFYTQTFEGTGGTTSSATRDARAFGHIPSADSRDVRVRGQLDSNRTQDVRLTAIGETSHSVDIRVTGETAAGVDTADSRDVRVTGGVPADSSTTRDVRVTGRLDSTDSRDVRVRGQLDSSAAQDVRVTGRADASDIRDVRVTGFIASDTTLDVRTQGFDTSFARYDVIVKGQLDSNFSANAYTSGQIAESRANDVRVVGRADSFVTRDVRTRGEVTTTQAQDVRVTGHATATDERDARVTGRADASLAVDVRLIGAIPASHAVDVRAFGIGAADLATDVRVRGRLDNEQDWNVRTFGVLASSHSVDVRLIGRDQRLLQHTEGGAGLRRIYRHGRVS